MPLKYTDVFRIDAVKQVVERWGDLITHCFPIDFKLVLFATIHRLESSLN